MSVSFYWCLCSISAEEYRTLKPKFDAAEKQATIPELYRQAYTLCMESPFSILPRYIPFDELPEDKKKIELYKMALLNVV